MQEAARQRSKLVASDEPVPLSVSSTQVSAHVMGTPPSCVHAIWHFTIAMHAGSPAHVCA